MQTIKQTANEYLNAGLSVIPISGNKTSLVKWSNYRYHLPTPADIETWFTDNVNNIAAICGGVSGGLECIDFDLKNDETGTLFDEYISTVEAIEPGLLDKIVIQQTPSKGYHFLYRCANYEGNLKLAKNEKKLTVIETRGKGGYFLIAPSQGYKILNNRTIHDIPVISPYERDLLINTARTFNTLLDYKQNKSQPKFADPFNTGDRRPGDLFNNARDLSFLYEAGFTEAYRQGNKIALYRPGKSRGSISATFNHIPDRLYIFSSNIPELESGCIYDLFSALAFLKFNGDFAECARDLANKGYKSDTTENYNFYFGRIKELI